MFKRALFVAAAFACSLAPAFAQGPAPGRGAELVQLSGAHVVLESIVGEFFSAAPLEEDARFLAAWEASGRAALAPDMLNRRVGAALDAVLDAGEQQALIDFYSSPLGRRIVELESAVALLLLDEEETARTLTQGEEILARISAERRSALVEIYLLSGGEDAAIIVVEAMLRGTLLGLFLGFSGGAIAVPWDLIDAVVEMQMAELLDAVLDANYFQATAAYAYETLTDEELDQYVEVMRQPLMQRFYAVTYAAISSILHDALVDFGQEFGLRLIPRPLT